MKCDGIACIIIITSTLCMQSMSIIYTQNMHPIATHFVHDFSLTFSLIQFSYNAAQCSLESLHNGWKRALHIQVGPETDDRELNAIRQLETAVSVYIRKVPSTYEQIQAITKVCGVYK